MAPVRAPRIAAAAALACYMALLGAAHAQQHIYKKDLPDHRRMASESVEDLKKEMRYKEEENRMMVGATYDELRTSCPEEVRKCHDEPQCHKYIQDTRPTKDGKPRPKKKKPLKGSKEEEEGTPPPTTAQERLHACFDKSDIAREKKDHMLKVFKARSDVADDIKCAFCVEFTAGTLVDALERQLTGRKGLIASRDLANRRKLELKTVTLIGELCDDENFVARLPGLYDLRSCIEGKKRSKHCPDPDATMWLAKEFVPKEQSQEDYKACLKREEDGWLEFKEERGLGTSGEGSSEEDKKRYEKLCTSSIGALQKNFRDYDQHLYMRMKNKARSWHKHVYTRICHDELVSHDEEIAKAFVEGYFNSNDKDKNATLVRKMAAEEGCMGICDPHASVKKKKEAKKKKKARKKARKAAKAAREKAAKEEEEEAAKAEKVAKEDQVEKAEKAEKVAQVELDPLYKGTSSDKEEEKEEEKGEDKEEL